MNKTCYKCKKTLPLGDFNRDTSRIDGHAYMCRLCWREYQKTPERRANSNKCHRAAYPKHRAKNFFNSARRLYGLTPATYNALFVRQNGKCAICGLVLVPAASQAFKRQTAHVDHDHTTGRVRGLLCGWCNPGLGRFQDSSDLLRKALAYLEQS